MVYAFYVDLCIVFRREQNRKQIGSFILYILTRFNVLRVEKDIAGLLFDKIALTGGFGTQSPADALF